MLNDKNYDWDKDFRELEKIERDSNATNIREISDVIISSISISDYLNNEVGLYNAKATHGEKSEKVCCPVHGEKTPSFFYNDKMGTYNCFGCGSHGTVINLHKDITGLNYYESARDLVKKYKLDKYLTEVNKKDKERDKYNKKKNKIKELKESKKSKGKKINNRSNISGVLVDKERMKNIYIEEAISILRKVNEGRVILNCDKGIFYELVDKVLIYNYCDEEILNKIKDKIK